MAKSKGWIKIDRSIVDNSLWKSDEPFDMRSAWIDLILMANHEDGEVITKRGDVIKVPRGSMFTSVRSLSARWHWSHGKVERYTEMLKNLKMIEKIGTRNGTLLSLVKYSDFQDSRYARGGADGGADGGRTRIIKNEKEKKSNYSVPVSMEETLEAMKRFAKKGGQEA